MCWMYVAKANYKFGRQLRPTNTVARLSFRAIPRNRTNGFGKALTQVEIRFNWSLGQYLLARLINTWWRHQMETFSTLLALSVGNSPVTAQRYGLWRGALMFSMICTWINGWVNNREAGDLIRHRAHYDVTAMNSAHILASARALSVYNMMLKMRSHLLVFRIFPPVRNSYFTRPELLLNFPDGRPQWIKLNKNQLHVQKFSYSKMPPKIPLTVSLQFWSRGGWVNTKR